MTAVSTGAIETTTPSLQFPRVWLGFVTVGALLVILGIVAVGSPLVMGLATALLIGWVLMAGGVVELVHGLTEREWRGFFLNLLSGILYLVIGFMIVANPAATLLTVTLLIAMFLIVSGIFRTVGAIVERFPHRWWMLLNGIISLLLGVAIWRQWPLSGAWVVGLFVGIEMVLHGCSLMALGMAAKRIRGVVASRISAVTA